MLKGHPFESTACMMNVKEENKSKIDLGLGIVIDYVAQFNTYIHLITHITIWMCTFSED